MLLSSRPFRPGIAQADDSVERGCTRTAVHLISEEVPGTLKLEACTGRGLPDKRLNLGVTDEMDRLIVDIVQVVTRIRAGHGALEQSVVQTHGDGVRVPCGYPVNRALDLAAIHRIATPFKCLLRCFCRNRMHRHYGTGSLRCLTKRKHEKQQYGDSIQQDRRRMLSGIGCCKAASRFS